MGPAEASVLFHPNNSGQAVPDNRLLLHRRCAVLVAEVLHCLLHQAEPLGVMVPKVLKVGGYIPIWSRTL